MCFLACQVTVTVGDSGRCFCAHDVFRALINSLCLSIRAGDCRTLFPKQTYSLPPVLRAIRARNRQPQQEPDGVADLRVIAVIQHRVEGGVDVTKPRAGVDDVERNSVAAVALN